MGGRRGLWKRGRVRGVPCESRGVGRSRRRLGAGALRRASSLEHVSIAQRTRLWRAVQAEYGRTDLEMNEEDLQDITNLLKTHKLLHLRIEGHCGVDVRPRWLAVSLAAERASVVRDALIQLGAPKRRIVAVSRGNRAPRVLASGRRGAANGRVELFVRLFDDDSFQGDYAEYPPRGTYDRLEPAESAEWPAPLLRAKAAMKAECGMVARWWGFVTASVSQLFCDAIAAFLRARHRAHLGRSLAPRREGRQTANVTT
ncbi:hypothetical protein M885DRAFT_518928 [Pelagophyceae sp. CCMP2097]|nr:hypothetical protein M885DRAFT_518928 [Pelagophyceae sp. CCMP2097]